MQGDACAVKDFLWPFPRLYHFFDPAPPLSKQWTSTLGHVRLRMEKDFSTNAPELLTSFVNSS